MNTYSYTLYCQLIEVQMLKLRKKHWYWEYQDANIEKSYNHIGNNTIRYSAKAHSPVKKIAIQQGTQLQLVHATVDGVTNTCRR